MRPLVRAALFVLCAHGFALAQDPQPPELRAPVPSAADLQAPALPGSPATGAPAAASPAQAETLPATLPPGEELRSGMESAPSIDSGTLPRDLSPWGMFADADRVVQAVIIGLALASVLTWTVWLVKSLEIAGARLSTRAALRRLEQARSLDEAVVAFSQRRGAAVWLVTAALRETSLSADLVERGRVEGVKERIAARLARIEAAAGRRLMRGTGVLASIGATAPFVGLFGTVWGIMNAFIGISEAETTNLAVVAPGIAEALLATAFGLVAAIPAVVIYNLFARAIGAHRAGLADASAAVLRLASRDLDRGLVLGVTRAGAE